MNIQNLLAWHNLIFLLPFVLSALLLVASVVMMGDGDSEGDGDAGDSEGGDADAGDADGGDNSGDSDGDAAHQPHAGPHATDSGLSGLLAMGSAPLSIRLASFGIGFGFAGFWANQLLLGGNVAPNIVQVLPSLLIALLFGWLAMWGTSRLFARLMPPMETSVVSREALFGLTGRVLFEVTETTGRIRVYDEGGTIHEHSCRIATGHVAIAKGRTARIVDKRQDGQLLVEEVA